MKKTLRTRLFLSYVLLTALILVVAGLTLTVTWRGLQDRLILARLRAATPLSARLVRELMRRESSLDTVAQELSAPLAPRKGRILLVQQGRVVGDSAQGKLVGTSLPLNIPPTQIRRAAREPLVGRFTAPDGRTYLYALTVILPPKNAPPRPPLFVLQISPRRFPNVISEIGQQLLWAALMAVLAGLGFSWFISRWITRPLVQIAQAADQIAQGNLDFQLQVTGPAEVEHVARQFNHMAQEVRAARQAQQEFFANVSHDLKTPLTVIQGFAQALNEGVIDDLESARRAAAIIQRETQHMTHLVNQVLDLARLESGRAPLRREPLDLKALVQECVQRFQTAAEQKEITLTFQGEPVIVRGDWDRLMQLCSNLLENALRHTPAGGEVHCRVGPAADAAEMAELVVQDTGPGIPPAMQKRIFDRFYQGDQARRKGSAGLGLAIVQEIARAHSGEVQVHSRPGQGASFRVLLRK